MSVKKSFSTLGFIWWLFIFSSTCFAQTPAQLQAQTKAIAMELRCPVSLNQSVYESEAPIAAELKALIYKKLQSGESKEAIVSFIADRYGEQIRYEPAMSGTTAALWILPILLFSLLAGWLAYALKKRAQTNRRRS